MVQQPHSDLRRLIVNVSRSHTSKHTQLVGLPWMGDQHFAEACTCQAHSKHKRQISLSSARSEPTIPAMKRPQIYSSDSPVVEFTT
jgi:hypothetical protein